MALQYSLVYCVLLKDEEILEGIVKSYQAFHENLWPNHIMLFNVHPLCVHRDFLLLLLLLTTDNI